QSLGHETLALDHDIERCLDPLAQEGIVVRQEAGTWRIADRYRADLRDALSSETVESNSALRQLKRLNMANIRSLLGASPPIRALLDHARVAARSEFPVLVRGERGSGHALLARAIHDLSPRAEGPFVAFVTSEVADGDMDSALFDKAYADAEGGSIYIEEIGTLPTLCQARVGRLAGCERSADVRLIASASESTEALVLAGALDPQLHKILSVFNLVLPPLRHRPEHVARVLDLSDDKPRFTVGARETLRAHTWPGNLDELQAVKTALNAIEHSPIERAEVAAVIAVTGWGSTTAIRYDGLPLSAVVKAAILRALERTGGNVTAAARDLHVSKVTLYRHLEQYQTQDPNLLQRIRRDSSTDRRS
ncbi:MAG: DNA-binding NtrC family response regulator, partial [Myxococcota bacterium]